MSAQSVTCTDAVDITDAVTTHSQLHLTFSDTVGISEAFSEHTTHSYTVLPTNVIGITDVVTYALTYIPYDTWRPVLRPDNHLVLACRTPVGEHDSPTGLTHMQLWTFANTGAHEKLVAGIGFGEALSGSWTSFGHPEWAPDGNDVVVVAETSTEFRISVLDATDFGWS